MELYNILSYLRFFFNNFLHQFLERVHNSKEIRNLQGLFVLTVGYIDLKTYPLTKHNYIRFFYIAFVLAIQKRTDLNLLPPSPSRQSTTCSYNPVLGNFTVLQMKKTCRMDKIKFLFL